MSNNYVSTAQPATQIINAIANYCGRAEHNGKDWKCKCPTCGRHSLSVTHGQQIPILIRCWHCADNGINDGFTEQCEIFVEAGLLPPTQRTLKKFSAKEWREYHEAKREDARQQWDRLRPIKPDDLAAKYLRARGLELFITHPALRTHSGLCQHLTGALFPVLVARVFHVEYGICAIQLTFLEFDGSDHVRDFEPRQTRGSKKGGAVWIGAPRFYPVPSRAINTLRTSSLCRLVRRRHRRHGSAAGDALAKVARPLYTVPYAIGSRHQARSHGTHREDGFYQLSPHRRVLGAGNFPGPYPAWLRRIHRLRWHRQREFRDCHIGEHKSAGTLSCLVDPHRTGALPRSKGLDAP